MARSIEERLEALRETAIRGARNVRADVASIGEWGEMAELPAPAHRDALAAIGQSLAQNAERLESGAGGDALDAVRTTLAEAAQQLQADIDRLEALVAEASGAQAALDEEAREAFDSLRVWLGNHVDWLELGIAADVEQR